MKKRLVSMAVALSMALSLFPVFSLTASAESLQGSGTEGAPYLISSPEDLMTYSAQNGYRGKYVKLTADIDMTGYDYQTICPTLGTGSGGFWYGYLDGDGHTISGMTKTLFGVINCLNWASGSSTYVGQKGWIKNLTIEGDIDGPAFAKSTYSTYDTDTSNRNQYFVMENCFFKGTAKEAGLIGSASGYRDSHNRNYINNCGVIGEIIGTSGSVGGLVGQGSPYITKSFASVTISGSGSSIGGLVGQSNGQGISITDSYFAGSITTTSASAKVGSILGYRNAKATLTRCYAYDTEANAIVGSGSVTKTNLYYLTGQYLKGTDGTTGLTEAQFAASGSYGETIDNIDYFSAFDFENTWTTSTFGRPVLKDTAETANRKLLVTSEITAEAEYGLSPDTINLTDYVRYSTGESTADQFTYEITSNEVVWEETEMNDDGEEVAVADGEKRYLASLSGNSVTLSDEASLGTHTVIIKGTYIPGGLLGDKEKTIVLTITETVKIEVPPPETSIFTFPYSRMIKLRQIGFKDDNWQWAEPNTIPKDYQQYMAIYPVEDPSVKDYYYYNGIKAGNYDEERQAIVDYVYLDVTTSDESPYQVGVTVIDADTERPLEDATVSSTFAYEFPNGNVTNTEGYVYSELTAGNHIVYAEKTRYTKSSNSITVAKNNANTLTIPIVPERIPVELPVLRDETGKPVADARITVTRTSDNPTSAKAWNGGNDSARYQAGTTQEFPEGYYRLDATSYGYAGKTIYMVVTYDYVKFYKDESRTVELVGDEVVEGMKTIKLSNPIYNVEVNRTVGGPVTVRVSLQNLKVTSGTFGLHYDSKKFSFNPETDIVFNNENNVYLDKTPETTYADNISSEDAAWTNDLGYYVFRWRAGADENTYAELNTELGAVTIATFTFTLNEGVDIYNDITNDAFTVMPWTETKAARAYKTYYDSVYTEETNPEAVGLYKFDEYWRKTDTANISGALQQGRIESSKAVVNGIDTGGFFQAAVNEDLSSENLASFYDIMTVIDYKFKIKNTALRFTVYDRATGEPLPNAKVRLYSLGETLPQTDTTDDLGRVTFMVNTSAGNEVTYTYSVERDGYWPIPETLAAEDREAVTVTPNVAKNVDVPMDLRIYHVPEVLGDTLTLTGKGDLAGERFGYNGHDFHFRVKAAPGYKIETYPTKATVTIGEEGEEGYYQGEITPNDDKLFIIEGEHLNQPAILGDDNLQRVFGEGWDQFRQPNEDGYRSYNIKIEFDRFVAVPIDLNVTALAGTNGKVSYDGTGSDFADVTETITADHEYKIGGIAPDDESKNTVGKFTFSGDTYTAEVDGEEKELQYQVDKVFINGVQVHDYDNETQFEYIVGDVKQDTDIAVTFWDGVTHSSDSVMTLVVGDYGEADVTAPVVDEDIRLTRRTYLNPEHLTFAAVPDAGYELYSIRTQLDDELPVEYDISGVDKKVNNEFTFDPVAGRSKKVYVTFKNQLAEITPTVFVKSYVESGSGTITPFGLLVYNIYDTVTLDLAADTENKWDVSGVKVSPYGKNDEGTVRSFPEIKTTNQYVIDSIQTDTEVGAIFEEHKYTVTGKVDLSQGKDLWSGGGDGYGDVMSGATVTFYRTGDVNGEALDDEMAIPTVTTANRTEAVFTAAIPAGTWKVVVSKQGYVNYIITGYLLNPATDPAEGDAIQFAENNKVITPVIGSTTDGKAVSLIDAAGVRSGMRDNITNAAKAKADVDNNGTPDTLDMAFVLANFGARTTYVKYNDEFLN